MGKTSVYSRKEVFLSVGGKQIRTFKSIKFNPGTGKRVVSNDNSAGELVVTEKNPTPAFVEITISQVNADNETLAAMEAVRAEYAVTVEKTVNGSESIISPAVFIDLPEENIDEEVTDVTWRLEGRLVKHQIYGSVQLSA